MKDDEKVFFKVCYMFRLSGIFSVRDIVNIFEGVIHHKRCWYLLEKWCGLGFYNYGVTLDLGWFESIDSMPERYKALLREMV